MKHNIQIFENPLFGELRTTSKNDEVLFCLNDVMRSLGLNNVTDLKKRLKDPHLDTIEVGVTTGVKADGTPAIQNINMIFINEPNLYRCIFQSRKKEAEQFQDWVFEEVLPTIRKHGGYLTENKIAEALLNPDTLIQLATTLKQERAERELLQNQNKLQELEIMKQAPKVKYFDRVIQSDALIPITVIAKELGVSGTSLNNRLQELKVQYKLAGQWLLYSKYQDKGYTGTKTTTFTDSSGKIKTQIRTYWTEKGRKFIHSVVKNKIRKHIDYDAQLV